MALEALSRGASVVVVETALSALTAIKENGCSLRAEWDVVSGDLSVKASTLGEFDIIFLDPPYAFDPAVALASVSGILARDGRLLLEADKRTNMPATASGFSLVKVKRYGNSQVVYYTNTMA